MLAKSLHYRGNNPIALAIIVLLITLLAGCDGSSSTPAVVVPLTPLLHDKVIISVGSSALLPLVNEAAKQYALAHPDVKILVDGGGSAIGITKVAADEVDIGNSDVAADEFASIDANVLVDHRVCVQGFTLVVNPNVTIDNLSREQVIGIFTGKITNWREINGQELPIEVVSRPNVSGTRRVFTRVVLNGGDPNGNIAEVGQINLREDSSSAVAQEIGQNPGAIGYLALAYFNQDLKLKKLKYQGVEANADNIIAGKYPIWSFGHMYTHGVAAPLTQEFLDYIASPQFQNSSVEKFGYIPISKTTGLPTP